MNVAPADLDVYDPVAFAGETHVTEDERSRLDRMLGAGGLVDAFRALHPDEPGFTWWDYRAGHFHRGLGLRIDLALRLRRPRCGRVPRVRHRPQLPQGLQALRPRAAAAGDGRRVADLGACQPACLARQVCDAEALERVACALERSHALG